LTVRAGKRLIVIIHQNRQPCHISAGCRFLFFPERTFAMSKKSQWLVAWDFAARPKSTFYKVMAQEFADIQHAQKSVAVCPDDFTARRLRALLDWYGAKVCAYNVRGVIAR
jgi:hypothetical protein